MTSLVTALRPPAPLSRDRQRAVLMAALLTVLVEIAVLLGVFPYLNIGRSTMPISVFSSAVVLALLGRRAFGHRARPGHAEPFWLAAIVGITFGAVMLDHTHNLLDVPGIAIAALGEEVVYRFAVPVLVASILVSLKVRTQPARVIGYAVGATWFVLLPWHRAQMNDAAQVLPFIAFAALAAVVAYRSGSILATGAVHTVMNMLTVLTYTGDISRVTRSAALGCLLVLLISTYGLRRTTAAPTTTPAPLPAGGPAPSTNGAVIDLRDGVLHSHIDAEGQATPLIESDPAEVRQDH